MKFDPAPDKRVRGLLLAGAAMLIAAAASAHDLWMVAGRYRLRPGEVSRVFITSGDRFPEGLSLLGEHRVASLVLQGPAGEEKITAFRVDGKALSFEIRPKEPGSYVLALGTRPRRVRLPADDFEDYLEENGLIQIRELRVELGENEAPAVERYAKWAKTVIDVEGEAETETAGDVPPAWAREIGHPIEIVPAANPNQLAPGDGLEVRVLFQGEPLEGAIVEGGLAGGPRRQVEATTDERGRARLSFPEPGRWYLRSLHMVRRDGDPALQWESFWCTLTFEIVEPPEAAPERGGVRGVPWP